MKITVHSIEMIHGVTDAILNAEIRCSVDDKTTYVQDFRTTFYKVPPERHGGDSKLDPFYAANNFASALNELAATVLQYAKNREFVGYILGANPRKLYKIAWCPYCKHDTVSEVT